VNGRPVVFMPAGCASLAGVQALVVEDHADSRELLALALQHRGAAVTAVSTAREALEALRIRPDVVVTDVTLRGEDGYWLLDQIRARAEYAALPVIALSGRLLGDGDRPRPLPEFDVAVLKPVDPFVLCDLIAHVLGKDRT